MIETHNFHRDTLVNWCVFFSWRCLGLSTTSKELTNDLHGGKIKLTLVNTFTQIPEGVNPHTEFV